MSHTGVEVFDFLLFSIYPVFGILAIELISRLIKAPKWIKLWVQAAVSIGFGVYYWFILPAPQNFPLIVAERIISILSLCSSCESKMNFSSSRRFSN